VIADDDPTLLIPEDQLRADGCETNAARYGTEALRRVRASRPYLLIIDIMMPRMDGLYLARENGSRADLPILTADPAIARYDVDTIS
jgi:CheY-like chemotaxis protein